MKVEPSALIDASLHKLKSHVPPELSPDLFDADCRTRGVTPTISQCLMDRPTCRHAMLFGVIYLCRQCRHQEMRNCGTYSAGGG